LRNHEVPEGFTVTYDIRNSEGFLRKEFNTRRGMSPVIRFFEGAIEAKLIDISSMIKYLVYSSAVLSARFPLNIVPKPGKPRVHRFRLRVKLYRFYGFLKLYCPGRRTVYVKYLKLFTGKD